ncbi:hypothetical protein AQUCO_01300504v1 [Aquilegia coerulea]|uniref:Superoxide dismutase copper chaperone n=1 Tax=Aquilegia coerulea TaxID=218851 RepID=A0A2G5E240_AQUCA|nr:hypothetical protein AQUCO_01300504v1 [Aquilegia coerulea]
MAFFRTLTTTTVAAAAIVPAALTITSTNSSFFKTPNRFLSLSSTSIFSLSRNFTPPRTSLQMDSVTSTTSPTAQKDIILPELMTEFMVDMTCEGCVNAVKNKLQTVDGVKGVEVDLSNQVVRVLGSSPVKTMADALEQTGRKARLIGQGNPEDFSVSAAVSEFKGPDVFGVVRLAQVNMELARVEASFSGLSPGKHGWSINEFGDLTKGAASTGKPLGDLGTLDAQENGEAFFSGVKPMLRVVDLIGRSIVLYETQDRSDPGIAAAVIARSAGVGENYKKLCTCDGTTIWESNNTDFTVSKV